MSLSKTGQTGESQITGAAPPQRFVQLDLMRGFVLWWMGFANAYFALSQTQERWLSHDGAAMSPADLIMVFFFLMIGFNLPLVAALKNKSPRELLEYSLKRAGLLVLLGCGLISYTIILFGYDLTVIFRSVLVVLGVAMALDGVLLYLLKNNRKPVFLLTISLTAIVFFTLRDTAGFLPDNLRFLSPWFLLTSLWGILLSQSLLKEPDLFARRLAIFGALSLFAGTLIAFFLQETPSRLVINSSYIFLSWGLIGLPLALLWRTRPPFPKEIKNESRAAKALRLAGAHPLSFWIIQRVVIGIAVLVATWIYYQSQGMGFYFTEEPVRPRVIENHTLAVAAAIATAFVCALAHALFIVIYKKRKTGKQD